MTCVNRSRIQGIDGDGVYIISEGATHAVVHCRPTAATVRSLKEAAAKSSGVDRSRRGRINCQSAHVRSAGDAEVI